MIDARRQAREMLLGKVKALVGDRRVLEAIEAVPREAFVPAQMRDMAWSNRPLPIGENQTISQPLVVARMCELLELRPEDRVLDVGTGSGYHAAVLARLAGHVFSVERHRSLSAQAARNLDAAGIENVTLLVGDGSKGYPEEAPYAAINVAAAASGGVPAALEQQLAPGGRLVAPVGDAKQRLMVACRTDGVEHSELEPVQFVPLV
jgi:protein-L-isoaspartate(D-aspartate) O-methyltransferase